MRGASMHGVSVRVTCAWDASCDPRAAATAAAAVFREEGRTRDWRVAGRTFLSR